MLPVIDRMIGAIPRIGIICIIMRYGKAIFSIIPDRFIRRASTNPLATPIAKPSAARNTVVAALESTSCVAVMD